MSIRLSRLSHVAGLAGAIVFVSDAAASSHCGSGGSPPKIAALAVVLSRSMWPTYSPRDLLTVIRYPPHSAPDRGDLIYFELTPEQSAKFVYLVPRPTVYFKRVVGLGGDKIQMIDGVLVINGTAVPRVRGADYVMKEDDGTEKKVARYRETLPNGASYDTLDLGRVDFVDNTPVFDVPRGHLFVLGDNRENSTDSRDLETLGYISVGNVIGCVVDKTDRPEFAGAPAAGRGQPESKPPATAPLAATSESGTDDSSELGALDVQRMAPPSNPPSELVPGAPQSALCNTALRALRMCQ